MFVRKLFIFIVIPCFLFGLFLYPNTTQAATAQTADGTYFSLKYPDLNNSGRIWISKDATGALPTVILLHGHLGSPPGVTENINDTTAAYIGPKAKRRLDGLMSTMVKDGNLPPMMFVAPIDGLNQDVRSWRQRGGTEPFNFDELIQKINQAVQSAGVSVDQSKIVVAGHSNGGTDSPNVGLYSVLTKPRTTPIFAAVALDAGVTGRGAQIYNGITTQKPPNYIGIVARNTQGESAWKTAMLGGNPTKITCEDDFFVQEQCLSNADGTVLFYKAKGKDGTAHNEVIPKFIQHALPKLFGLEGLNVPSGGGAAGTSQPTTASIGDVRSLLRVPNLIINIPGLNFSSKEEVGRAVQEDTGGFFINIPFIGQYIAAIFTFSVAAAAVLSMIMMVIGGVQWTVSRGDPTAIGSAKGRISKAIIGLLFALGSYGILFTVNPNLVKFQDIRVLFIVRSEIDTSPEEDDSIDYSTGAGGSVERPKWNKDTFTCLDKDGDKFNAARPDNDPITNFSRAKTIEKHPHAGVPPRSSMAKPYDCDGKLKSLRGGPTKIQTVAEMQEPLCKAAEIAIRKGYELRIASHWRPFETQVDLWCKSLRPVDAGVGGSGPSAPRGRFVAVPGFSNHGHGRAVDVILAKDGKNLHGTDGDGQCRVKTEIVETLADIFYEADPGFARLQSEIWHFEYGTKGAKKKERTRSKPKHCR